MATNDEQRRVEILVNGAKANASVKDMQARVALLYNEWKKAERGTDAYVRKSKELKNARKQLDDVNKSVRTTRGSMNSLKTSVTNLLPAFSATFIASAVLAAIGGLITKIREFQDANTELRSILLLEKEDMEALTEASKEHGRTTAFTAAEVAKLQIEYAKLGFSQREILAATGATLDLAAATKTDLAQAATVAGATVRGFGLDASETQRVVDVMALSFSKSSLDINKFQTAMATVAPVAKTFGFSVEETTALLAQLTDAGFDASSAGTATRNILLNLADTNGALAKSLGGPITNISDLSVGLKDLRKRGIDLNGALELTDKRSVAAFSRFLDAADDAETLSGALEKAGGTAERMAETQLDTLTGSMTKFGSALDGVILSIEDGEGIIGKGIKSIVDAGTSALNVFGSDQLSFWEKIPALLGGTNLVVAEMTVKAREAVEAHEELTEQRRIENTVNAALQGDTEAYIRSLEREVEAAEAAGRSSGNRKQVLEEIRRQLDLNVKAQEDAAAAEAAAEQTRRVEAKKTAEEKAKLREKEIAAERALEDLRIGVMTEGIEKERAIIDTNFARKIEDLQLEGAQLIEAELLLTQQKEDALKALEEEQRLLREEEEAEREALDMEAEAEKEEIEKLALEDKLNQALITEEQHFEQLLAIEERYLNKKLAALKAAGKGETLEAKKVQSEIIALQKEKQDYVIASEQAENDFKLQMLHNGMSFAKEGLRFAIELLAEGTTARRNAGNALKAIQTAEVVTAGIIEVANIWKGAATLGPIAGPIFGGLQTGIAVARSGVAISKILATKYADGGNTIDMTYNNGTWTQPNGGGADYIGAFANGGHVRSPQLGLIGEAGPEWVAPNWMMQSPKYANTIAYLESARKTRAFEDGGSTAPIEAAASVPATVTDNFNLDMMKQIQLLEEIKSLLQAWPEKLEVVNSIIDLDEKLKTYYEIQEKGSIG